MSQSVADLHICRLGHLFPVKESVPLVLITIVGIRNVGRVVERIASLKRPARPLGEPSQHGTIAQPRLDGLISRGLGSPEPLELGGRDAVGRAPDGHAVGERAQKVEILCDAGRRESRRPMPGVSAMVDVEVRTVQGCAGDDVSARDGAVGVGPQLAVAHQAHAVGPMTADGAGLKDQGEQKPK